MENRRGETEKERLEQLAAVAERTRRLLEPREALLLAVWAGVYLVGLGSLWASVRWATMPLLGVLGFFGSTAFGILVTAREIRGRLRGLRGQASRHVRDAVIAWSVVVVVWGVGVAIFVSGRPGVSGAEFAATASSLAVALLGVWYVVVAVGRRALVGVGLGLVAVGTIASVIVSPELSLLVLWIGATGAFVWGALRAWSSERRDSCNRGARA